MRDAGVEQTDDGETIVPYYDEARQVVVCKIICDSRSWWAPPGREILPLGVERLPHSSWIAARAALLVVEGESDCLAAREAFVEGDARTLCWYVLGVPGSNVWRPTWRKYLAPFVRVYVCGDGDLAGSRLNDAVRSSVPWARVVELPEGEDVRSILQRDGREGLMPYLEAADVDARLAAALALAPDLDTFVALLREGDEQL